MNSQPAPSTPDRDYKLASQQNRKTRFRFAARGIQAARDRGEGQVRSWLVVMPDGTAAVGFMHSVEGEDTPSEGPAT
jgi:hypothetical protein